MMHEIGHAIDFSMGSKRNELNPRSHEDKIGNKRVQAAFDKLMDTVSNSPFMKLNRGIDHIDNNAEKFARAFEVYAFVKAVELLDKGEVTEDFFKTYAPDLFSGRKFKSEDRKAMIKDIVISMDRIFKEDSIRKSWF